jgi:hypothetical protein
LLLSVAIQLRGTKATQVTGQNLQSFLLVANKMLPGIKKKKKKYNLRVF